MPPLPPSTRTRELPYEQRPKFGLYLLDIFGNRELIYCDPHVDCVKPIPLAARPRPPVVPDMVRDAKDAGPARPATIGVMNVYASDLAWPSDVNISALRIIQLFQNYGGGDEPPMGYTGMALPRIPLGTVPVYEDGSAYFEAPVNRMIYFQALDENGLAVQSMRSATVVHSGETLTCVGCHEAKWKTPTLRNREPPLAFRRGRPDKITPEVCGTEPFTFARHVQPVLAAKCADCHVKEGKGPQNLANTTLTVFKGGRNKNGLASASFAELRPYTWFYALNYSVKDNRSVPGQIGARAAKLLKCLSPEHHGVKLTPQERRLITLWMDLGSPYYCSIFDRGKQHAGELVYPRFDFDPDNFFGLDRPSSPFPTNLSLD
jgi:cytochrome c553